MERRIHHNSMTSKNNYKSNGMKSWILFVIAQLIYYMSNLDDSIGKILLKLQKDDPDTFKKLMEKAQKENPELFDDSIDEDNKK